MNSKCSNVPVNMWRATVKTDKEKVLSGDSDSSRVADISIFIHFISIELESIPARTGQRHVGTESS